jgi:predicted ATPase
MPKTVGFMEGAVRLTKWCVVTGAPCSGKTTLVQALQNRGYRIIPEAAREVIRERIAHGSSLRQITANAAKFERMILERKQAVEKSLPTDQTIIFDRGIPDSIAYFKIAGLPTSVAYQLSREVRYKKVFFLEPLPFIADGERLENAAQAVRLGKLIKAVYHELGYAMIVVPAVSVHRRVQIVSAYLL